MADRTPKKVVSKPSVHVCRCCNDNVLERNHSIDLYGPKATKESVLALLERLTGFKCDINDGLSSKVCRSSYEKIMKIKKFSDIFLRSTKQQQSLIRFKRCKTQGDSPSRKPVSGSPGHAIKKVAESDTSALNHKSCFFLPRAILPAPSVSVSEPLKEDERKRRVLPRGLFPQLPKPKSKCVEILSQSGLHNPSVSQNPLNLDKSYIY
ncbi:hypothetical protein P5673_018102 [Acropora cervicornis]|uniref:ZAD domain-containing protein n=1 Tax=Acropora cervicornis TaxID=6130 RepID=A0AAD9QDU0_ACRCE|nr:hypothetical protein P5673_018102 [Acropora cervicornis]